jgi:hypothetical protein
MSNALLKNGHRTLIEIVGITPFFEEISVTPIGAEADEPVEQTTMRTNNWRSFMGGALLTATEVQAKVAYAPTALPQVIPILRQNRFCRVYYPDGAVVSFYAIVMSFVPDEHQTNERPEATLVLRPSNLTTSNPPAEVGPIFITSAAPTTVAP